MCNLDQILTGWGIEMGDVDKRNVHTDALATLGMILGEGEKRDAIHLAVEPVVAGERLRRGADIGINQLDGKAYASTVAGKVKHIGIVDPFLANDVVAPGERFWLIVYPRMITSLRHVWEHPDLPADGVVAQVSDVTAQVKAIAYLQSYADEIDEPYDYLVNVARSHYDYEKGLTKSYPDYFVQGGRFEGWGVEQEFWDNFCVAFDLSPFDQGVYAPGFFSCSC